ncbi:MAG: hypothetical protein WB816_00605 [Methylocystis sp.]
MSLSNSGEFGAIRAVTASGVGPPLAILTDFHRSWGFPKVANLIDIDVRAFSRLRPGDAVILEALSMNGAAAERASPPNADAASGTRTAPPLSSEFLLSVNSISGVWGGDE